MKYRIENIINKINMGILQGQHIITLPISKQTIGFISLLQKEGFCALSKGEKHLFMHLRLLAKENRPVVRKLVLIGSAGRKVSVGWKQLRSLRQGTSLSVISTSQGFLSQSTAISKRIGGLLICNIII